MNGDEKIIQFSKAKLFWLLAGSLMFVGGCYWLLNGASQVPGPDGPSLDATVNRAVGLFGMAFFGLTGLIAVWKLLDRGPGLILRADGIVDTSSGFAAGLIPWRDIAGFDVWTFKQTRYLVIRLVAPEQYVERGNFLRRSAYRMNLKLCGSPLAISATALQIDFEELQRLCTAYHAKYGTAA